MSRFSVFSLKAGLVIAGLALLLSAAISTQSSAQTTDANTVSVSQVRIVRISEVRGAVQIDRGNGHGYEQAIANLPVVQANRMKTAVGVAEVEFEDNSTLRLGPNTEVEFPQLSRMADGSTVSSVRVLSGIAYVSLLKSGGKAANQFHLNFGDRSIPLDPGAHIRLILDEQEAKLTSMSGTLRLGEANGTLEVPHKQTATFSLLDQGEPVVAKNKDTGSLDTWDKQNSQYHERVASSSDFGNVPYSYGLSDMMYYGAFSDMGGCGMMWRPYFTSAAWDPYSAGTWAYYPSVGYSWVSPYPWGWMPYHYGSWSFCPGAGWGWMPGGSWMGLNNIVYTAQQPRKPIGIVPKGRTPPRLPVAPHPPKTGEATLINLNQTALVRSGIDAKEGAFVFRKDSAGLGIPRNELGNLRGFSQHTIQKGTVATPIFATVGGGAPVTTRGGRSAFAPVAIHRGFAPSAPSFGGSSGGSFSGGVRAGSGVVSSTPISSSHTSVPAGPHH